MNRKSCRAEELINALWSPRTMFGDQDDIGVLLKENRVAEVHKEIIQQPMKSSCSLTVAAPPGVRYAHIAKLTDSSAQAL